MPTTKQPLFELKPWSGIRNPDSMPYMLKRGIASLMWRENGEAKKGYNSNVTSKHFVKSYKIIGANLVRGKFLKPPDSVQGRLVLTAKGKQRERELNLAGSVKKLDSLKRARRALEYLDDMLVQLKVDLEAGVIKETP